MCEYCEKGKKIEEVENDNIYFEIYGKHLRVIGKVLNIPIGRDIIIEYCPMCRKEARRVKVEQFEIKSVEKIPHKLEEGIIYVCLECNVAVHLCACGCREKTVTPLGYGGWTLTYNENGLSLNPSIGNFNMPCKSHYFITNNKVRWC